MSEKRENDELKEKLIFSSDTNINPQRKSIAEEKLEMQDLSIKSNNNQWLIDSPLNKAPNDQLLDHNEEQKSFEASPLILKKSQNTQSVKDANNFGNIVNQAASQFAQTGYKTSKANYNQSMIGSINRMPNRESSVNQSIQDIIKGKEGAPADHVSQTGTKLTMTQRRKKLLWSIYTFNYSEPLLISLHLLNSVISPSIGTSIYFLYALLLMSVMMSKVAQTIKIKFSLSLGMILTSVIILISKCVVIFFIYSQQLIPTFTADDLLYYENLGIIIIQNQALIDELRTYGYDGAQAILAIIITFVYRSHYNDVQKPETQDEKTSRLLHRQFFEGIDTLCIVAFVALVVETVFVQTILQAFIMLLLVIKVFVWAYGMTDENQQMRYLILTFSQVILLLQLLATFTLQIPSILVDASRSNLSMIFDMFGILLHNLPTYSVVLHLVSITIAVNLIQLYKVVRISFLTNQNHSRPILIGENDDDADKIDKVGAPGQDNVSQIAGGITPGRSRKPSIVKSTQFRKKSVLSKFKERQIDLHKVNVDNEESFIQNVAQKYYTHFSPQIWLWLCRLTIFIWSYAYHDFQSWVMLAWIMHSTLFKSTRSFIKVTIMYYLPIFLVIFLFYYVINIPHVIEFQRFGVNTDLWRTYGFYQFSVPALEVGLMMGALLPFFMVIRSRKQLDENSKDDAKDSFLKKLTAESSPIFYYFVFILINNLDLLVFIVIFFSGVNKIDFYHIFLLFFFVAYIIWPKWFIRNYIVLLVYVDFFVFEKYLYTLIVHYIPQDSLFIKIAQVMGLSTEYNDVSTQKYFKYAPKFQQWLLIIVVFLQYQVHQIIKNKEIIDKYREIGRDNFKKRYPRLYQYWEVVQHLNKEFLILVSFMVFFMIIILTTKSIINWGFQIILCIFIISYIGVSNESPENSGIKRLSKVWFMITWYSSLVLILQITYQFAALPIVREALKIDQFLNMLPLWIRRNINIIGFTVYTTYIWEKFLAYLIYFSVGIYVRKQMIIWNLQPKPDKTIKEELKDKSVSRNSDMQLDYFEEKNQINWNQEFIKIRFSTPYLVFKVRKIWVVIDNMSRSLFVVISLMIMVLSFYWQISLSMAIHLTCFISLCLAIASKLYRNRKVEKSKLNNKDSEGNRHAKIITIEQCGNHWTEYKRTVNLLQVQVRQRVWLFQFVLTLMCMVIIYPTEFLWQIRQTFIDLQDPQIVNIIEYFIFYLFWGGVYHSPYEKSQHGYFYNFYGYLIILILLIFEKKGQQWSLNRFGCDSESIKWFQEVELGLASLKQTNKVQQILIPIAEQVVKEEQEGEGSDHSEGVPFFGIHEENKQIDESLKSKESFVICPKLVQLDNTPQNNLNPVELKEELKKWIMKKYRIKILNGVKILLEDTIQLMILTSCVYKDSIITLFLLFGVFLYQRSRTIKQMQRLAWIVGLCMILEYGLALSNLTSDNNPMDFPDPFNPYPKNAQDEGQFFIPWYRKIALLRDNFDWAMYLGMGISNTKLNGIWIDYFVMGLIQTYLLYFGCQLFSIDLKVQKGEYLLEKFEKYCLLIHQDCSKQVIKKETKKLKHQLVIFNLYKYLQAAIFMHFHQVTIVVTLLLAVLARSLFSFGYILVCMIMIYENHKFFQKEQKNFRLQSVLKYWLQPYVFFDLTLQLVYQIPLEFLHRDQDLGIKWCWQNIIGFQDIWIKDTNNVDEVVVRSIMFIILKAFTYYFVTLQIQIFDSTAYKEFISKDFKKFIDMADTKGMSIIWKLNNEKIQKIREQESEGHKMNDMLQNLKKILKKWQSQYTQGSTQVVDKQQLDLSQKDNSLIKDETQQLSHHNLIDELGGKQTANIKSSLRLKALSIASIQTSESKRATTKMIASFHSSSENESSIPIIEESQFSLEDEELLIKIKSKLGFFPNSLIMIKKTFTDQIVHIESEKYLRKVASDMQAGRTNIYTKFERKMLSDIREYKQIKSLEGQNIVQDIDIKDMKRTSELIKFWKMVQAYLVLILQIISTHSDFVCYILMIVSMMKNAGLISIIYPFVVFGYAILEEVNPRKKVWYAIMIYTELLILVKFLYQLSFWEAVFYDTQLDNFQDIMNGIHVGLLRQASGAFGEMLGYFLPEILILFAIMSHIQKEIMIGLLDIKETHIEDIREALIRYIEHNKEQSPLKPNQFNSLIDVFNPKLQKAVTQYEEYNFRRTHSFYEIQNKQYFQDFERLIQDNQPEQHVLGQIQSKKGKAASLPDQDELNQIYLELQEQHSIKEKRKLNFAMRFLQGTQTLLYKNDYFGKLFPNIKEQKPGKDLYAITATFQFLICMFLIFFYTKMDADVANVNDSVQYNQFSGQMVIALFIQIILMIIDRYLYKSKTFIAVQQKQYNNSNLKPQQQQPPNEVQQRGKSFIQFLSNKAPSLYQEEEDKSEQEDKRKTIDKQIHLEQTMITFSIVFKFYLQWFLLIFVHFFVFWFFPIHGNEKLQNHPYCVKNAAQLNIKCNEFGGNLSLRVFYLLYCCYFWVSGLQIRFGVPEMKKGNFMMNNYTMANKLAFQFLMAVPFLFELKTFVDWTFTRTALDVFQWFILQGTHGELFVARCVQSRYQRKPLGEQIPWFFKLGLGGLGQLSIILLIAGPLLLFSNFNPISTANPVTNAIIKCNIQVEPTGSLAKNTINLFSNNYVTQLTSITDDQFNKMSFQDVARTKSYEESLVQYVKMNNFADTNWAASLPNRLQLQKEFESANLTNSTTKIYFQLTFTFDRQNPNAPTASQQSIIDLKLPENIQVLRGFTRAFSLNCDADKNANTSIFIPPFFTGVQYLNDKESTQMDTNLHWFKGLKVFYSCNNYWQVDQVISKPNATYAYPESNITNSNLTGVAFYTFSSKIAPSYFKFSIITFYLSIVLVIGKVFRGVCIVAANRLFVWEIPNSEKLLLLCECVYIYRMRGQLDQEEQLYFTFVDIMRSPEMIKAITGSAMKKKTD